MKRMKVVIDRDLELLTEMVNKELGRTDVEVRLVNVEYIKNEGFHAYLEYYNLRHQSDADSLDNKSDDKLTLKWNNGKGVVKRRRPAYQDDEDYYEDDEYLDVN